MPKTKQYWLIKSEPDVFGIDDLEAKQTEHWDGIRNYQARNFMRDSMQVGDLCFFYHSNAKPPGVVGLARVASESYPDHTAWDSKSKYFDKRSTKEKPLWEMVDMAYVETFNTMITLDQLKAEAALEDMLVVKRGQRLSIQPVEAKHAKHLLKMAKANTKA